VLPAGGLRGVGAAVAARRTLLLGDAHRAQAPVPQQTVRTGEVLVAAVALVRFLPAVHPLVSLQVVALDESHVTHVTAKGLLSCVCEDVTFQVVTAPEGSIAVLTDEVLLQLCQVLLTQADVWHLDLWFLVKFAGRHYSRLPVTVRCTCLWWRWLVLLLAQLVGRARLAVLLLAGLHVLTLAGTHLLLVQQTRRGELTVLTDHMLRGVLRLSHHRRATDSRWQHHVAVSVPVVMPVSVAVPMAVTVPMSMSVAVSVVMAMAVAVTVSPLLVVPLSGSQGRHHLLAAVVVVVAARRHGVGLHESHARQHRLTAQ